MAKARERWYKAADPEKWREKGLLNEFESYHAFSGRYLKEFRMEVLRAGFKAAWSEKDLQTFVKVATKFAEEALQKDEKLLLWYKQGLFTNWCCTWYLKPPRP